MGMLTWRRGIKGIARFTLAVDRRNARRNDGAEQQTADFISCVAFDRQAEFAEKYLHQGTKMAVVGRIQTGSYTNREGKRIYTTDVVIEEMEFAERKVEQQTENPAAGVTGGVYDKDGFMDIPDECEGLPFAE